MSIQKNAVIIFKRFSTNGILENMQTKFFENAEWAKIFEHNNHSGTVLFTSLDECLKSNTQDKYSKIYLLDYFKSKNNKYEFLLEYPDDVPNQYNRWIQNNNPCNEFVPTTTSGDGTAAGYTTVHMDWNGHYWGGLTRQNSDATTISPTYLSGSVGHTNWWFAIGSSSVHAGGIPGPVNAITGRVQLWVRIDNLPDETKCQITNECMIANDFYEV